MATGRIPINGTAAIQETIVDAKGDLIVATGADAVARLAVGANGTVLTADSSAATGVAWATAGGGDTTWSLVNTGGTALTSAGTITISGITKDKLMVYVSAGSTTSITQATVQFRFNSDSTSKYSFAGLQLRATATYTGAGGAATINVVGNDINSQTKIEAITLGNDASDTFSGFMTLSGAKGSIKTYNLSFASDYNSGSNGPRPQVSGGLYTGSSAITSISIISSNGTFDGGTIYVYEG